MWGLQFNFGPLKGFQSGALCSLIPGLPRNIVFMTVLIIFHDLHAEGGEVHVSRSYIPLHLPTMAIASTSGTVSLFILLVNGSYPKEGAPKMKPHIS